VEFLGMLKVRIVRGIGLAVRDLLSSDPYVVVTLGQQVLKTRVINRSLNPVWNEEIILSVPSPPQPLKLVHSLTWISISHTMGRDFSYICLHRQIRSA
jgi:stromal membrane-associated protein